jgi:hypothetical protein
MLAKHGQVFRGRNRMRAVTPRMLRRNRTSRLGPAFPLCCLAAFVGLVLWEYTQRLFWRIPIDPNDLIASAIGVGIALVGTRGGHKR